MASLWTSLLRFVFIATVVYGKPLNDECSDTDGCSVRSPVNLKIEHVVGKAKFSLPPELRQMNIAVNLMKNMTHLMLVPNDPVNCINDAIGSIITSFCYERTVIRWGLSRTNGSDHSIDGKKWAMEFQHYFKIPVEDSRVVDRFALGVFAMCNGSSGISHAYAVSPTTEGWANLTSTTHQSYEGFSNVAILSTDGTSMDMKQSSEYMSSKNKMPNLMENITSATYHYATHNTSSTTNGGNPSTYRQDHFTEVYQTSQEMENSLSKSDSSKSGGMRLSVHNLLGFLKNNSSRAMLHVADFLPSNSTNFYEYCGSSLYDTCGKSVTWLIYEVPLQVPHELLVYLRKMISQDMEQTYNQVDLKSSLFYSDYKSGQRGLVSSLIQIFCLTLAVYIVL